MSIFGDIERFVAELWPFRVPIGIAIVVVLVVIGIVAGRRGWFRAAAARPKLTISIVAIVLVIGLPVAWVLGSPLIIRTELNEAPPVVASGATGTAETSAAIGDADAAETGATGGTLLEGEFQGADDFHFGSGQAKLIETAPGTLVLSLQDFSVLNGPDLFVYLSPDPNGWTEDAVLLGELKATDGSFSYEVPAGVDPADVGSAVIWCRAFGVLFASAALEPATA